MSNKSAVQLAKNSIFYSRTKHIQIRYYFIRAILEDGIFALVKNEGARNLTNMLTKTVTIDKLKLCATPIGFLN